MAGSKACKFSSHIQVEASRPVGKSCGVPCPVSCVPWGGALSSLCRLPNRWSESQHGQAEAQRRTESEVTCDDTEESRLLHFSKQRFVTYK